MSRKTLTLAALATIAAGILATAAPANAATGNAIRNVVQPSNYRITVSPNTAMTSTADIWPQRTSASNVACFKPALTSHSIWGGIYWGGQVRCFAGSGNGTLALYGGMP